MRPMDTFAPFSAVAGGALLGLAATPLMAADGRIAGIGGILGGALSPDESSRGGRVAFPTGLPPGALVAHLAGAELDPHPMGPVSLVLGAGLLVGLGTQPGNGYSSGHGVCGVSRLSRRSLLATALS
jgi:uncharacterized membrane protein YedE/YeeE